MGSQACARGQGPGRYVTHGLTGMYTRAGAGPLCDSWAHRHVHAGRGRATMPRAGLRFRWTGAAGRVSESTLKQQDGDLIQGAAAAGVRVGSAMRGASPARRPAGRPGRPPRRGLHSRGPIRLAAAWQWAWRVNGGGTDPSRVSGWTPSLSESVTRHRQAWVGPADVSRHLPWTVRWRGLLRGCHGWS
jgi:hypothetical protein